MHQGKRSEPLELLVVTILGLMLRFWGGRNSLTENGVLLPGYDEFYHMRRILYTTQNFPDVIWFDSYLNYPLGWVNEWPPLFDQIAAAFCLLLGQNTRPGVEMAASFVPMIIGAITTIAVYFLVREIFDHKVAILASLMTLLAPTYLQYTMFAAMDHHSLEVLLVICTLLFLVLASSRREKRIIFATLAGFSIAALGYTWHGAVLYLAVLPIYAAIEMTLDLRDKRSSRETATTLLLSLAVALILLLPYSNASWLSPSFAGIAAMFGATIIMVGMAYFMARRDLNWKAFPLSIIILFTSLLLLSLISGGLFGIGGLIEYGSELIWGGGMIGKISEAEPLIYDLITLKQVAFSTLGANLLYALAGFAILWILVRKSEGGKRQGRLILLLWSALTIILTFGQLRFLYMSTIAMGILISILFFALLDRIKERLRDSNPKAILPALLILFLILALPTVAEVVSSVAYGQPMIKGDWQESIAWIKENSNSTSFFNAPEKTPEYSIMCWWDYGNWIMYMGERPVVANNFQAGWEDAARFYLSESEANATAILDARGSKYIFVDNSMAYGKLGAIANWANEDLTTYFKAEDYSKSEITVIPTARLFNTTLGKLYYFDGAGTGHFRLIYESKTLLGENPPKSMVKVFEYVPGALIKVRSGADQKVGTVLNMTSNQERPFIYANQAEMKGGSFEMRVPYSTESRYGCRAISPYLVFSGNEQGVKMRNINVSEEDVLRGRTIEVAF